MISKFSFHFWLLAFCISILTVSVEGMLFIPRERTRNDNYTVSSAVKKMASRIPLNTTAGWKQFSFLKKNPIFFDVSFAVGSEGIIVKAPKLILAVASPVFKREFVGYLETALRVDAEEIHLLPNLNPEAFKLFVELTILDSWSVEALKALELPSNQLLHLMSICHKYRMTAALTNLTELAKDFLRDFGTHVKPEEFLLLSQAQLETILASDELPMEEIDVFNYACRWASEQCQVRAMEVTGANIRVVLGPIIFQIRFPLMSITEFVSVIQQHGILTTEEIAQIAHFILEGEYVFEFEINRSPLISVTLNNVTELKFKVEKRREKIAITSVPAGSSTVSLAQVFSVVDTPFVCNGSSKSIEFNMGMPIALLGVGFLGPIDADSFYDVTVDIIEDYDIRRPPMAKRIFAQKSKTFYFIFDQPVGLHAKPYVWNQSFSLYIMSFTLKGPNTRSIEYQGTPKRIYDGNNEFVIRSGSPQLVEIIYKAD